MRLSDLYYAPFALFFWVARAVVGEKWAMRLTKLLHATPYYVGAYLVGCWSAHLWQLPQVDRMFGVFALGCMCLFSSWARPRP